MILQSRLDDIRARLQAATSGPWVIRRYGDDISAIALPDDGSFGGSPCVIKADIYSDPMVLDISEEDAEFVSHAPEDIQWLLSEVERLQGLLK
jgi:hypothetical protein